MNVLNKLLTALFVISGHAALASGFETTCDDSTMGAFSLKTDEMAKITSGSLGLIYTDYRTCDLTKENTRIVVEFGEYVLKSDCIGSARLLYNHVEKILYLTDPDENRKIAVSSCTAFGFDIDPDRLVFNLDASAEDNLDTTSRSDLDKKAKALLYQQAQTQCQTSRRSGHVRLMSALNMTHTSDHFGMHGTSIADALFMCD